MKKFLLAGCLILSLLNTKSQTVLIDPTGDGGFETGTDETTNGWTTVRANNNNRSWYVGTGQTGYTGARCAFIGNNATTVGTGSAERKVHLYRSVTIPVGATNIQLVFKYKQATSDYAGTTYYDYISVYLTTTAPVLNSLPAAADRVFGPYPTVDVPNFTQQTVTIPDTYAGTTNFLSFSFVADDVNPKGYGAVDDISLTYTAALPVTFTSLSGENKQNKNIIHWQTATEANNKGFEIQRSANGTTYSSISFVASKHATGNGNILTTYSYIDESPLAGNILYRLKQVDKNGKESYSQSVSIKQTTKNNFSVSTVYPNPATTTLNYLVVSNEVERINVVVINSEGKSIITLNRNIKAGNNNLSINTAKLTKGSYILKITNSKNEIVTKQFVK